MNRLRKVEDNYLNEFNKYQKYLYTVVADYENEILTFTYFNKETRIEITIDIYLNEDVPFSLFICNRNNYDEILKEGNYIYLNGIIEELDKYLL